MNYTQKFAELKNLFDKSKENTNADFSGIGIHNFPFTSNDSLVLPIEETDTELHRDIAFKDSMIEENRTFNYPVFIPKSSVPFKSAIILLHGLNEKSWYKYLPWAYYLAEQTNRPVILFPISFHMNRCPETWGNPRAMIPLLNQRQKIGKLEMASFANVALSQRLTDDPLRFFTSGKQSAEDICCLLQQIKMGEHSYLEKDAQVDFFAYSIGAFLSQILFIANPNGLLNNSKLFLFCGGACFSEMFGTSKLIMDSQAFISLRKYYLGDFLKEMKTTTPFSDYVTKSPLGNAFRAMIAPESLRSFRESMLKRLSNQVKIIALKKDKVIPASYIESTFSCIKNRVRSMVEVLDFPYEYSHEIPFPVLTNPNYLQVDQSFERVFRSAVDFLK